MSEALWACICKCIYSDNSFFFREQIDINVIVLIKIYRFEEVMIRSNGSHCVCFYRFRTDEKQLKAINFKETP